MSYIPKRIPLILLGPLILLFFVFLSSSPKNNDEEIIVTIPEGASLGQVANILDDAGIVRSPTLLRLYLTFTDRETSVEAGIYSFKEPENVYEVSRRIWRGEHGINTVKVTIPEGFTAVQIADRVIESFSDVASSTLGPITDENRQSIRDQFIENEGYLFPETYFFFASSSIDEIIARMSNEFNRVINEFNFGDDIAKRDAVIMASILEAEAKTVLDKQIIAGILYNRLREGIPLQVDATLKYITGRGSADLTKTDLASNSPFNSYKFVGLPPNPIGNAGRDSIFAALNPLPSEYYYFLTGADGNMYYAEDHKGHIRNRELYLK